MKTKLIIIVIVLAVIAAAVWILRSGTSVQGPTKSVTPPPQNPTEILKSLSATNTPTSAAFIKQQEDILKSLSAPVATSSASSTNPSSMGAPAQSAAEQEAILKSLQAK